MIPDPVVSVIPALCLLALFVVGYRRDIRDARLFAAMRRAVQHPYSDRLWHHRFALTHKLFWGPCPNCGEPFGGHEMTGHTVPHPDPKQAARGVRRSLCPPCSATAPNPATTNYKDYRKTLSARARKG